MQTLRIRAGDLVIIEGFDDIPEHQFQVEEVSEDLVTGTVLKGPLAGEYGEPDIELVLRVLSPDGNGLSQGTVVTLIPVVLTHKIPTQNQNRGNCPRKETLCLQK